MTTVSIFILMAGCGSGSETATTAAADTTSSSSTLSSLQTNIFTPSCALSGCHSSGSASGGLSLAAGESFSNLVGIASSQTTSLKRVQASDPASSYLINKLEGTQTSVRGSGTTMPQGGTLTAAQIQTIKDWISAGALNN